MPSPSSELKHYTLRAAAGTGKTTSLIEQVVQSVNQLKEKNQKPPRIIITTFTRKASGEVKERIMKRAIEEKDWELVNAVSDSSRIFISTLHGILYYFLKKHHPHWPSFSQLINERQITFSARSVLRDIFDSSYSPLLEHYKYEELLTLLLQHGEDLISLRPLSKKEMEEQWLNTLQSMIQTNSEMDCSSLNKRKEDLLKYKKESLDKKEALLFDKLFTACRPKNFQKLEDSYLLFQKLAQNFHTHWKKFKEKKGFIQIEDLERETLQIIQKQKTVVSAFSKEWKAWFIDEYQDINPIQEEILNAFTQKARKVWAVGDPQQSIYLFRRADPNVFKRRENKTKSQGIWEIKNKNFRSCSSLISFFNDFFALDPQKKFDSMSSMKTSSSKEAVQLLAYSDEKEKKLILAQRIRHLAAADTPGSVCVLLKTNKEAADTGHFLKKLKFPVQIHSQNILRREIIDALFFLKFLVQPLDNDSLIGLLRSPYFYLPDWEIAVHSKKNHSLWASLNQEIKNHPSVQALNDLIKKSAAEGISSAFSSFLENHFVIDLCYHQDPTGEQERSLWSLLIEMKTKEKNSDFKYYRFVEEKINQFKTHSVDEGGGSPPLLNFIQLMTIHQSKGLEFEHVIIPNVDESLTPPDSERLIVSPGSQRWGFSLYDENKEAVHSVQQKLWKEAKKTENLLEQDRLLYVAMTRAKKTLTLTCREKNLMKPSNQNTWTGRFHYFTKIREEIEKNPDKNPIDLKKKNYSLKICKTNSIA